MANPILTAAARWDEKRSHWQINVQKEYKRKSFYSSTPGRRGKAECEAKARQWLESKIEDDPRFEDAWDAYLKERTLQVGTGGQVDDESIGRNWMLPSLKGKKLSKITLQDWQDILNSAATAGRAKATVDNIRTRMTGFRKYCKKKRWPVEDMELLENHSDKVKEKRSLTREQVNSIFKDSSTTYRGELIRDPYWNAYRFSIVYGYRRGEVCGLQWSDLDGEWLAVHRSINRFNEQTNGKNKNARRRVKLGKQAAQILKDQKEYLKEMGIVSPWIFPDPDTGNRSHPERLYAAWKRYQAFHDLPGLTYHETRHSMITLCRRDMPVELLKMVVGHSKDFDTFGKYGHDLAEDFEEAAADLDAILDKLLIG